MDVLIVATAMAHGHTLITRNTRHFRHIPLVVEAY
jgi:predicted nucleic acid-binding protein